MEGTPGGGPPTLLLAATSLVRLKSFPSLSSTFFTTKEGVGRDGGVE